LTITQNSIESALIPEYHQRDYDFYEWIKIWCDKCQKMQPVSTYCLHYYCCICCELLGFYPHLGFGSKIPCKWNNEGIELIPLRAEHI